MQSSRWADEIEDEDYVPATPTAVQEVNKHIPKDDERIVTEIKVDPDSGKKMQIFRTFRLEKQLVSKGVIERKKWPKFGQSKKDPPGPNSYTTVVADDVQIQFLGSDKAGGEATSAETNPFEAVPGKGIVKCRYCQDNHFSAKCPYKDAGLPPMENISRITDDSLMDGKKDSDVKPGIFLPPALRGGNRRGETMMSQSNRKDETTIRVSNLPETMSETDMQELCSPFGKIERIFLAKDRSTGVCKGFAFVTYQTRETAARALRALNGYGYDHLILNVEWSVKRND
uniref:Eukaryotic translation initiation factor 3 subunit G n=1 Tax=Isotomurus palustris TaxID=36144 RepID=A0A481T022_9HEXA|nr:eukaryotic translation initiation factor 3 subunit G [Isotomurus palustris]